MPGSVLVGRRTPGRGPEGQPNDVVAEPAPRQQGIEPLGAAGAGSSAPVAALGRASTRRAPSTSSRASALPATRSNARAMSSAPTPRARSSCSRPPAPRGAPRAAPAQVRARVLEVVHEPHAREPVEWPARAWPRRSPGRAVAARGPNACGACARAAEAPPRARRRGRSRARRHPGARRRTGPSWCSSPHPAHHEPRRERAEARPA